MEENIVYTHIPSKEFFDLYKRHLLWMRRGFCDGSIPSHEQRRLALTRKSLKGLLFQSLNLNQAHLIGCDMRGMRMIDVDFSGTQLDQSDLRDCVFDSCNFQTTSLENANLSHCTFYGCNFTGAHLKDADLTGTNGLYGIVPEVGEFQGFKKLAGGTVCHVKIPAAAGRVGGFTGRKCRAEYVEVIAGEGNSIYDGSIFYSPGLTVRAFNWDPDPRVECSGGIHFFLTRREAELYSF